MFTLRETEMGGGKVSLNLINVLLIQYISRILAGFVLGQIARSVLILKQTHGSGGAKL